jgi:Protein of unknown function (DUF1326)
MKKFFALSFLLLSVTAFAQISGVYMESRSADVYTGQCFANGEVNLVGDQAILGWQVEKGSWNGVKLDGLGVVAVVKAKATLGDPYGNPYPAKAVLIVDQRATAAQTEALKAFAQHQGGHLLEHVVRTESAAIEVALSQHNHGAAMLRAGNFATLQTRGLNEHDHLCGNEVTFYPPLTQVAHSMPAVATIDKFTGTGLGVNWETHEKRSAFLGTFALNGATAAELHGASEHTHAGGAD